MIMLLLYYAICISLLCKDCTPSVPLKTDIFRFFDRIPVRRNELPLFFSSKKRRMSVRVLEHCAVR